VSAPTRRIPQGSGDDGRADPRLSSALAGGSRTEVCAALVDARVLVPVTAVLTARAERGGDNGSESRLVLLQGVGGAPALPIFSSVETMTAWRRDLRPVRGVGRDVAAEAVERGLPALVLDVAGPHPVTVAGAALRSLAEGWVDAGAGVSTRTARVRTRPGSQGVPSASAFGPEVLDTVALEVTEDNGETWRPVLGLVLAPGAGPADAARAAGRLGTAVEVLPLARRVRYPHPP